jgi:hypothetical protein
LDEYWRLVEETKGALRDLAPSSSQDSQAILEPLIERWSAIEQVQLEDGSLVPVDSGYMVSVLSAGENRHALRMVEALLEAHENYPAQIFTTGDLDALDTILARPEFQWAEEQPNPVGQWIQGMLQRFFNWLDRLLGEGRNDGTIEVKGPPTSVLSIVVSIILVAVIGYVLWGLFNDLAAEARLQAEAGQADEVLTSQSAFARAQNLSRGGDFRSAVRYLYLSSLLLLDERGLLRYDRSKTNREYLRSISGSPELSEPLQEVIDVFDNVWYGYHALDEESFKHYSERVEELKDKKAS